MKKVNKTESKINTKARVASYRELVEGGGQAWKYGILSKDFSLKGFQAILAVPGLIRFLVR